MVKKLFSGINILLIIPFLSACFVSISALLPANIDSYEEFQNAKFGLPFPFIKQNLLISGAGGYEGSFPHRFALQLDFLDKEPKINFMSMNFILSTIIIYGVFLAAYFLIRRNKLR